MKESTGSPPPGSLDLGTTPNQTARRSDRRRLGWLATVVFHGLSGVTLDAPDDADAYELVMAVARSEPTVKDIAAALVAWH